MQLLRPVLRLSRLVQQLFRPVLQLSRLGQQLFRAVQQLFRQLVRPVLPLFQPVLQW
jgi:hypothetical protein